MTKIERASQLWPLLVLAATNRQVLTYGLVQKLTGLPRMTLGGFLDPLAKYCVQKKLPPLTVLVVSEKTGLPGSGFTSAEDIPRAQLAVFEYDWLGWGCPKPEKLEAAFQASKD